MQRAQGGETAPVAVSDADYSAYIREWCGLVADIPRDRLSCFIALVRDELATPFAGDAPAAEE